MSDPPPTLAGELLERLSKAGGEIGRNVEKAERPISDDRRWIAQLVIYVFAGSVIAVLLLTFWLAKTQPTTWKEPAQALLAIVAQVLLPVVTLVIGFYFRSESK